MVSKVSSKNISQQPISIEQLKVLAPCHQNWYEMPGNLQVKYCGECQKSVYNLSMLTRKEATILAKEKRLNLCIKYFEDEQGQIKFIEGIVERIQRRLLQENRFKRTAKMLSFVLTLFFGQQLIHQQIYAQDAIKYKNIFTEENVRKNHGRFAMGYTDFEYLYTDVKILSSKTLIGGILWDKGTRTFYDEVSRGTLAKDTEIKGILWAKGSELRYDPDLIISNGILVQPTVVQNILFPKGTLLTLNKDFQIKTVIAPVDLEIHNILWLKDNPIKFFNNGQIHMGTLVKDHSIQDILWQEKTKIVFHKNLKVASGFLATDTEVNNVLEKKGSVISFPEDYSQIIILLKKDMVINGISWKQGSNLVNGKIISGILVSDQEIQGIVWQKDAFIEFDNWGNIKSGVIAKNTLLNQILWHASTFIKLAYIQDKPLENQKSNDKSISNSSLNHKPVFSHVVMGTLAENTIVKGIEFKQNTLLTFYDEKDLLRFGTLASDTVIKGYKYNQNMSIWFYNHGGVAEILSS